MRPIHVILLVAAVGSIALHLWDREDRAAPSNAAAPSSAAPSFTTPTSFAAGDRHQRAPASRDTASPRQEIEASVHPTDPPPADPTPAEMRASYDARLVASGETPAAFHHEVDAIVADWLDRLPDGVELGAMRCYHDGCSIEQISDGSLVHAESSATFAESSAFQSFPGWRARSGPEPDANGRIHATWYFLAPEPG